MNYSAFPFDLSQEILSKYNKSPEFIKAEGVMKFTCSQGVNI
jgi:hypothetical protein